MHIKRWITAIIAIPILIYIIGPGPRWLLHLIFLVSALIALSEFYLMAPSPLSLWIRIASYSLTCLFFLIIHINQILLLPIIFILWAIIPLSFYLFTYTSSDSDIIGEIGYIVLGPLYVALPLAMMILIDKRPNGNMWLFFLLAIIFANDTGAFYFGKLMGRHKLYPLISPNKTWEGTVGGIFLSTLTAFAFLQIWHIHTFSWGILVLVLVMTILAQVGDLAESMLKRHKGIKDSGKILPGHGGLLDRIDGLLFAIPALYFFLIWTV
jgi:phosphatidate cytidylyltransferase